MAFSSRASLSDVAAIAGVGSVSLSLKDGLAREGRAILGGDLSFDLAQRAASAEELGFLSAQGRLSVVTLMRAMARRQGTHEAGDAAIIDIKAVDGLYPLAGAAVLDAPQPLADALAERDGAYGVVVDPAFLPRLGLSVGNSFSIGEARYRVAARLTASPTRSPAASASGRAC